jgi:hypothetical protein
MDCNRAFMVLTRGPFPSGAPEDWQVQQHIEGCPDCWQLAEALRPAGDVFHEAISPSEGRDLPGYWGGPNLEQSSASHRLRGGGVSVAHRARLATPQVQRPLLSTDSLAEAAGWREVAALLFVAGSLASVAISLAWLWQWRFGA